MKNIYTIFFLSLFSSTAIFCASNPILDFVIFDHEKVEIAVENDDVQNNRVSVRLFQDILSFKTVDKIKYIQVYNDQNKLLYQIPILSNKLEISKGLFETGLYKLNFYFSENVDVLSTQIKIK